MALIDILLATYNGEAWLEEQLDSLFAQDFTDWRLLVRDDGSNDKTMSILRAAQTRAGERLIIVADSGENLGPVGNFARLMEASTADYSMFCDQDDLWHPAKLRLSLTKMQEMESVCGPAIPLLVHTDFQVVDENLHVLATSGHRYQKVEPEKGQTLGRLLVQNVATGCTMMMNRALRERALPIPGEALMHDHWLSLVAACFGRMACLPQPTLSYRQHGGNQVGAQVWNLAYVWGLPFRLRFIRQVMTRNRRQAQALFARYRRDLRAGEAAVLDAFIRLPERGPLRRRCDIFRHGLFYCGFIRNFGWLILC